MVKTVYNLAREEFLSGLRNRWILVYSLSYLLLAIAISPFSLAGLNILGMKAVGKVLSALINISLYLVPLISLITSTVAIVGDRETNYMEWLMSNPVSEKAYLLGKFIGLILSIAVATLLGFGVASWFVILFLPPEDVSKYFLLISVALLLSAVYVAMGLLISVLSRTRYHALGTGFLIWFFTVFVFDLFMMSFLLSILNDPLIASLAATLNPIQGIRLNMISVIDPEMTFLGFTGVAELRENVWLVLGTSQAVVIGYTVLFAGLAYTYLRRQDLI